MRKNKVDGTWGMAKTWVLKPAATRNALERAVLAGTPSLSLDPKGGGRGILEKPSRRQLNATYLSGIPTEVSNMDVDRRFWNSVRWLGLIWFTSETSSFIEGSVTSGKRWSLGRWALERGL